MGIFFRAEYLVRLSLLGIELAFYLHRSWNRVQACFYFEFGLIFFCLEFVEFVRGFFRSEKHFGLSLFFFLQGLP